MSKHTLEEWIALYDAWIKACDDFDEAYDRKESLFQKFKEMADVHPLYGDHKGTAEVIEKYIGKMFLEARK